MSREYSREYWRDFLYNLVEAEVPVLKSFLASIRACALASRRESARAAFRGKSKIQSLTTTSFPGSFSFASLVVQRRESLGWRLLMLPSNFTQVVGSVNTKKDSGPAIHIMGDKQLFLLTI